MTIKNPYCLGVIQLPENTSENALSENESEKALAASA